MRRDNLSQLNPWIICRCRQLSRSVLARRPGKPTAVFAAPRRAETGQSLFGLPRGSMAPLCLAISRPAARKVLVKEALRESRLPIWLQARHVRHLRTRPRSSTLPHRVPSLLTSFDGRARTRHATTGTMRTCSASSLGCRSTILNVPRRLERVP